MKTILKLTLFMVMATMAATHASAQSKMTEEQKKEAKEKYEAFKQKLNLNEEQSKKVDEINATYLQGLGELKKSGAGKMAKYKKFRALQSDKDKKMKEVLNKDQYKIYKEYQAEVKEEFRNNRG